MFLLSRIAHMPGAGGQKELWPFMQIEVEPGSEETVACSSIEQL